MKNIQYGLKANQRGGKVNRDIRLKIVTNIDRPHITYDILTVLNKYDIGIKMMEVYTYVIYLKIPYIEENLYRDIVSDILSIYGIKTIDQIDLVAFEERNIEMKTILDIIPQGVIVLDTLGYIKYSNNYLAERILNIPTDYLINKNIKEFIQDELLQGTIASVRNKEVIINNEIFIADITPIYSEINKKIGFILSMNESNGGGIFHSKITFDDILSTSEEMVDVLEKAKIYAKQKNSLLITGESGTGKELLARSIHNYSDRKAKNFISISCGDLPEKLLEKELFGYGEKDTNKLSLIELADGGTIYFDNVEKLALGTQIKLLNLMQEEYIIKDFTGYKHRVDIKIISSCDESIYSLMEEGKFDKDLFNLLSTNILKIPPLRERKEEIVEFTKYFISDYKKSHDKKIVIKEDALKMLLEYHWPGNIRQLQNVLEVAAIASEQGIIEKDNIILDLEDRYVIKDDESLTEYLERIERDIIVKNLNRYKAIRKTARELSVTHTLLLNRIKKYDILDEEWK